MKVLHMDDSSDLRNLYQDMFKNDNHSITSISDGREGLELIKKETYDLILLDILMPEYSGMDFLQDLKNEKPSELKKVVVVSALKLEQSQIKQLLEFGIHSVEGKPHNLRSIINMQKNMVFK
jgi:DNA-binding response OmpR family regulator